MPLETTRAHHLLLRLFQSIQGNYASRMMNVNMGIVRMGNDMLLPREVLVIVTWSATLVYAA